jgi:hypothetical protein
MLWQKGEQFDHEWIRSRESGLRILHGTAVTVSERAVDVGGGSGGMSMTAVELARVGEVVVGRNDSDGV